MDSGVVLPGPESIEPTDGLCLVTDLAQTDEMPIVRETSHDVESVESKTGATDAGADDGDSDVFVCRRSSPDFDEEAAIAAAAVAAEGVTLFVYGWESVEPGPLSWVFPSLRAALDAVRTMRNAVAWSIASGSNCATVDDARASGTVLIEQTA